MSELSGPQTLTDKMAWETYNSNDLGKRSREKLARVTACNR